MKILSDGPSLTSAVPEKTLAITAYRNVKIVDMIQIAVIPFPRFVELWREELSIFPAARSVMICLTLDVIAVIFHRIRIIEYLHAVMITCSCSPSFTFRPTRRSMRYNVSLVDNSPTVWD